MPAQTATFRYRDLDDPVYSPVVVGDVVELEPGEIYEVIEVIPAECRWVMIASN
jgi:hypothetical protein